MLKVYGNRFFRWGVALMPLLFSFYFAWPVIFDIPLYLGKFTIFGIPFTILEVVTYLLFIFYIYFEYFDFRNENKTLVAVWVFIKRLFKKQQGRYVNNIFIPVFLLVLASVIGVLVAGDKKVALGILKGWIIAPILYFIMWSSITDDTYYVRKALHFYLFSAFVLSLFALWQVKNGQYLTIDQRASGPFESANYLAMYIGPAVAVFWVLIIKKFQKRIEFSGIEMWLLALECIATTLALYFSQSYAAILAVITAVFVYFVFRYGRGLLNYWKRIIVGGLIVITIVCGAIYLTQSQTYKYKNFLDFEGRSSSSVRLEVWSVATNFISQNPVLGIGLGQYERLYNDYAEQILGKKPYETPMLHAHSLYFSFWLYTGFLGLFALGWILFSCFVRLKFCMPYLRPYMRLGLVMLVVIVIHGIFDTTFWKNDLAYIFWFAVALSRI